MHYTWAMYRSPLLVRETRAFCCVSGIPLVEVSGVRDFILSGKILFNKMESFRLLLYKMRTRPTAT